MHLMEEVATGFHGTSATAVEEILRHGLQPATGGGHWLLSGARYLFEEPSITLGYARSRFGQDGVVLEVLYSTDKQLDLTRFDVGQAISRFGQAILDAADPELLATMRQNTGIREIDDFALTEATRNTNYRSVRAICAANRQPMHPRIFPPARPFWVVGDKVSGLNLHNHVQVAVIDPSAILRVTVFDHSGLIID